MRVQVRDDGDRVTVNLCIEVLERIIDRDVAGDTLIGSQDEREAIGELCDALIAVPE